MQESVKGGTIGYNPLARFLETTCSFAWIIFAVLALFFMPHWWYPIVLAIIAALVSGLLKAIPGVNLVVLLSSWVIVPITTILMYLSLFGII